MRMSDDPSDSDDEAMVPLDSEMNEETGLLGGSLSSVSSSVQSFRIARVARSYCFSLIASPFLIT